MNIRVLTPQDAEAYWNLRLRALKENPEAFAMTYEDAIQQENPVEMTAKRLQESESSFTLGAFDETGQLVGMVTLIRDMRIKLRHIANLVAMYVASETRGQRVGQRLVKALLDKAKGMNGIEQVQLSVITENEPARRLYRSVGFEAYGVTKHALKFGDQYWDDEHMVLFFNK